MHRLCYKGLRNYLIERRILYSSDTAYQWLDGNKPLWNYRKYTGWRHCIDQLEDVYSIGHISLDHMGSRASAYALLSETFKAELDDFLNTGLENREDDRYRISCARFLLYLQKNGLQSIVRLDYEKLIGFHNDDHHRSSASKDVYEDLIRIFLRYCAKQGKCSIGFSLALNKLLIHQIIRIPDDDLIIKSDQAALPVITWAILEDFLRGMAGVRYGSTVLKSTKHILVLLYIFLDMHRIRLSEENLWLWFKRIKPFLGTGWKQHRRCLCQFLHYIKTGSIITAFTGDPAYIPTVDKLPDWAGESISSYPGLLKREGWQESTITMHRSCCIRFCQYLQKISLSSFYEITTTTLNDFNLQDIHMTPEGKAAYNCRIRCFLIYLYEQGLTSNPYLYKALPTMSAPRTSIVQTLSEENVAYIWSLDPGSLSPRELRDYVIVYIGLTMGFRASDITSLQFSNINWKQRSISIVQQKTGKAITMPMPVKTGNILFRYLHDGRPKSLDVHVFIKHEASYDGLHHSVCAKALARFISAGNTCARGFHVVRRTFATSLLKSSTKVELIADSLGHSTDGTVHKYLSLDEERMRQCPVSMADVGISLRGGVFHA